MSMAGLSVLSALLHKKRMSSTGLCKRHVKDPPISISEAALLASLAMEQSRVYSLVMVALAVLGLVVNLVSIVLIGRRKRKSMFHALLKVRNG